MLFHQFTTSLIIILFLVGPSTAGRIDVYIQKFEQNGGGMLMLAKGNKTIAVKDACKAYVGFYLQSFEIPAAF
jgi:fumarate hydratase class I